jgi:predicted O-methyltransferase YrrM
MNYEFTNDWFDNAGAKSIWPGILKEWKPTKILEIGSYEGASASFVIESNTWGKIDLYCVDTWEGGLEHKQENIDMKSVERRFDRNVGIAKSKCNFSIDIIKRKGYSSDQLVELLHEGHQKSFDLIYIDGSHTAADVLLDALLSFKLLRVGGMMIFDDYLYHSINEKLLEAPKIGIDAFTSTHFDKIEILRLPIYQMFVKKLSE